MMLRKVLSVMSPLALSALAMTSTGCAPDQLNSNSSLSPNRLSPGKYSQSLSFIPTVLDDPYFTQQASWTTSAISYLWSYNDLNVFGTYSQLTLPQQEIIVAVIDTGIDKDHEDIVGRLWLNPVEGTDEHYNNGIDDDGDGFVDDYIGWDFVNHTNNPADDAGHGSHVAGTIAAIGNNAKGIVGVAPWVRIMPLKVCNSSGSCASSDIRAALAYAVQHGAKIVNLSLGEQDHGADSVAFDQAIADANRAGTLVFAAAGNSALDASLMTPANATYAVAVAAHNDLGNLCAFSDYGWRVDLSGPGCASRRGSDGSGILSLNSRKCGPGASQYCSNTNLVGDAYTLKAGTSMSTPHAVGMAAVAWTASPDATPLQIRQALLTTARAGSNNKDSNVGMGHLSGVNLVDEAKRAPGIRITSPRYGTTAHSMTVGFRIENRVKPLQWSLKYVLDTGSNSIDLTGGVVFASSTSDVSPQTSVDIQETFSPPASGDYLLILETTTDGRKYYDTTLVHST